MDRLELIAKNKSIELRMEDTCWCKVSFNDGNNVINLGADSLKIVVSKLLIAFLPIQNRRHFTYKNENMFTIVNLMDPHSTIVGKELDDLGLEILFIDKDGNLTPSITLSIEDIQEWIKKLTEFLIEYIPSLPQ